MPKQHARSPWIAATLEGVLLELRKIALRSGPDLLFEGTDWTIRRGECWGLVGAPSSGRSELVHGICGELPVVAGEIAYDFADAIPRLRDCPEEGVVHLLFEDLQSAVNRGEGFAQLRWNAGLDLEGETGAHFLSHDVVHEINPFEVVDPDPAARRRFDRLRRELIVLLDIEPLLTRTLDQVSNGERRKLVLAQALLKDPIVLFLDNPFDGLDPAYRRHLLEVLDRVRAIGPALVFLVPGEEELPDFVTHLARVEACRLQASGPWKRPRRARVPVASRVRLPRSWLDRLPKKKFRGPVVELEQVCIEHGQGRSLDGVSWRVEAGECWAITGPNGAGKSTLLSLLQGDHPQAYAQQIRVFDKPPGEGRSIWELKRRIGSVSPEAQLYFPSDLTVWDVVCTGFFDTLRLYDGCGRVRRGIAADWLDALGLGDRRDHPLGALSAAEQRLVLFARAVVKHPQLLILDEPCSGLTAEQRARFLAFVDRVVKVSGCTLLYVSHRKDEWPGCITHRLSLKAGRVTRRGR